MEPPYISIGSTEEAEAYRRQIGNWTVANLQQSIGWAQQPITIDYDGQTFLLLPEDEQDLPPLLCEESTLRAGGRSSNL